MNAVLCTNSECPEHDIPKGVPPEAVDVDVFCGGCGNITEPTTRQPDLDPQQENP